jgi:hypothetical protein
VHIVGFVKYVLSESDLMWVVLCAVKNEDIKGGVLLTLCITGAVISDRDLRYSP